MKKEDAMTERAKFKYSAKEGILELEGSEEFVSKHFESLTDLVRIISRNVVLEQKQDSSIQPPGEDSNSPDIKTQLSLTSQSQKTSIQNYPEQFSEINGKLKIVSEIPGTTKQTKMKNAAILYCYGSKLLGDEQVNSKDIRTVCEEHGCLDNANFSKVFSDKTIFISDGVKGGNKDVKLTFQGEKTAKELLGSD